MFKTWNLSSLRYSRALSFGHLNFEDLEFVSDFDIRILIAYEYKSLRHIDNLLSMLWH